MKTDQILDFWNSRANLGPLAGTNDFGLKQLEMETLATYIRDGQKVLDLGCGSGTTAFALNESKNLEITGMDFSPEMVKEANQERDKRGISAEKLNFFVQDIREIDGLLREQAGLYDVVMTERVLINLETWEEQKNAIKKIMQLVKPGGLYLMCENLREGLENLNLMRKDVGLEPIVSPWHNRYLQLEEVAEIDFAEIVEQRDFTSVYYLFSRVINAWLARESGEEPKYDAPINRLSLELSKFSQFENLNVGQTRLWVLRRPI